MAPRSAASENRFGIACMTAAMAFFIFNDALVKYASQTMPAAQLICVRGLLSIALVLAVAHAMGVSAKLPLIFSRRVALRAFVDAIASMLYLTALFHLPIANATAINLTSPLFMILYAALFMGDRVGTTRWLAILAGFGGVLLVIQPDADGFNGWAMVCLAGTLFHAARDLMTRGISPAVPSILITLSTSLAVTIVSGAVSVVEGWRAFGWQELALLAGASVFLSGGYFLIITSMRHGEMSLVAPFRYSGLLVALCLGYLVWGDVPNVLAWSGIALLIASGLYLLYSDKLQRKAAAAGSG